MRFDTPELREAVAGAIEVWKLEVSPSHDNDFSEDLVVVTVPRFHPGAYDDRIITPNTEFGLLLPKQEDVLRIMRRTSWRHPSPKFAFGFLHEYMGIWHYHVVLGSSSKYRRLRIVTAVDGYANTRRQ